MKKKNEQKVTGSRSKKCERPTLLEFLAGFHLEAHKLMGDDVKIDPKLPIAPLPHWGKNIVKQFGKTIMKPVIKLRPSKKSTCQDYGKIIGILNRGITFYRTDAWKILEDERFTELSEITADVWEKIQPENQMRVHVIKQLGRPVAKTEGLDDLIDELMEKRIKHFEELRDQAFRFMATRSAKDNAMFHKGVAQGYEMFIDEEARFCGDRGRTEIYMELISSVHEIEKMRRMLPPRNDSDLYEHLKQGYRFPNGREAGIVWLRKVCDDISLYMTGKRGRPPGARCVPVF